MGGIVFYRGNFADRNYVLANEKAFMQRFVDTGHKTKWCGFWCPPIKCIDYYAYRISCNSQDFWLGWDNCEKFRLSKWGALHTFSNDKLSIEEDIFLPQGLGSMVSVLRIGNISEEKLEMKIYLEAAVDMRTKYENWHERPYKTHFNKVRESVQIKTISKPWYFMFGVGKTPRLKSVNFNEESDYREHHPGERLRCFVPGNYSVDFDLQAGESIEIPFIFTGNDKSDRTLTKDFDEVYKDWKTLLKEKINHHENKETELYIETPDEGLDEAFSWARWSLNSLYHESDTVSGFFAGYPWFLEFWARDSFIASLGLTSIDELDKTKTILNTFRRKGLPSKIETNGNMEFGFADTHPFFIIAGLHYYERTGDLLFKRNLDFTVKNLIKEVKFEKGLIAHDPKFTWMDTLERDHAIEIQAMWSKIFSVYKKTLHTKLEKEINTIYWDNEETYYADSIKTNGKSVKVNSNTSNPLFRLLFNEPDDIKTLAVLEKIRSHFESDWGVSTWSNIAQGYSPWGYHTGSVWGHTTGIAASVGLKNGDLKAGLKYLKVLASDIKNNTLGGMFENMRADNGELLGCGIQAWSMSMFLLSVVEYLFGIKYHSDSSTLYLKPAMPDDWNKMKIIGKKIDGTPADFVFVKNGGNVKIKINAKNKFKGKINCNLEMPEYIKNIEVNNEKVEGNIATFQLDKKNVLVCYCGK